MGTKFEKGKWYRNSEWRDNAYCKADGSNVHDKIYFTEYIDNDNHAYKLDWWQNREGIMREVPVSEIQQYLPLNHPDKQPIEKWSVGSYVVIVEKQHGVLLPQGTIRKIEEYSDNVICVLGGALGTCREEKGAIKWFATKEEAEEFAKSLVEIKESKPKQLTVDDLVEGEIYVERYSLWDYEYILKYGMRKAILVADNQNHRFRNQRVCDIGNSESVIRPATPQEKKHLNVCIQQDKFINQEDLDLYDDVTFELKTVMKDEPKYDYEVVHCTTQEEVNFAISKCKSKTSLLYSKGLNLESELKKYPEGICINPKKNAYSGLDWYKNQNAKIYSFQEWCKKFNHKPNFMTKQEPERKEPSMEELLEEAEKRYPSGTIFKTLTKGNTYVSTGIIREDTLTLRKISMYVEDNDFDMSSGTIYLDGEWAKIVSLPEKIEEDWIPRKQVCLSNFNEETKIKINFKQTIKI